jgi:hypothetical protein
METISRESRRLSASAAASRARVIFSPCIEPERSRTMARFTGGRSPVRFSSLPVTPTRTQADCFVSAFRTECAAATDRVSCASRGSFDSATGISRHRPASRPAVNPVVAFMVLSVCCSRGCRMGLQPADQGLHENSLHKLTGPAGTASRRAGRRHSCYSELDVNCDPGWSGRCQKFVRSL